MVAATLSGAEIDAQFRARGTFSLTNLQGTAIVSYRFGASPGEHVQVFYPTHRTPMLVGLRNFLINQARLGPVGYR